MKKALILFVLFTTFFVFSDQKGEEIAKKYFDLKEADDSYNILKMILVDKNNNKKVRKIEMFSKSTGEGMNTFIKFIEPADVKGTTFLTIAHKKGDDEQRLYLPALGKIRRISSSNKDRNFMGSDLNYYDMESREFGDNEYKYIKDDTYNGMDCWVIEMESKDPNCPYSKSLAWISKADNFMYKQEVYNKKNGQLFKTIIMHEVKEIKGILTAVKIVVDNHEENHKTLLEKENIIINSGIKDEVFSVNNLMK